MRTKSIPTIFCPRCGTYLGRRPTCTCGWERPHPLPLPGKSHWQVQAGVPVSALRLVSAPAGRLLLVSLGRRGDSEGGVLALDPTTGEKRWIYRTEAPVVAAATQAGGRLLVGDEAGHLHALDVEGNAFWEVSLDGAVRAAPASDPVDEVLVYVATDAGNISAVDVRQGDVVWRRRLPDGLVVTAAPRPVGKQLLVAAEGAPWEGGTLLGLPRTRGKITWRHEFEANPHVAPVIAGRRLLIALTDGTLLALDARTRTEQWRFQTRDGRAIVASPLVVGETVYVGAHDHHLYALELATGTVHWAFDAGHGLNTSPVVAGGVICVGDNRGRLWAVSPETSEPVWHTSLTQQPDVLSGPVADESDVYAGTGEGDVWSLPWHLGRWRALAEQAEATGGASAAATWWALADERERAAEGFADAGMDEYAALIYEACRGRLTAAARAWERAAKADDAPLQRARRWQRAARAWEALQESQRARTCRRRAALARGAPFLEVEVIGSDPFKVGQVAGLKLRVINHAPAIACDLVVGVESEHLGTPEPRKRPELAEEERWELRLDGLEPLRAGTITLVLRARYTDQAGNEHSSWWETTVRVAGPDQPPIEAQNLFTGPARVTYVEGDVGSIRSEGADEAEGTAVTVQGSVGQALVEEGLTQVGEDVAHARITGGRLDVGGDVGKLDVKRKEDDEPKS